MASNIVTYLRRERRKWGLTQKEVASLVGLRSRSQISAIERGVAPPTVQQLLAFQCLFGMTAAQLFPRLFQDAEDLVFHATQTLIDTTKTGATLRAIRKKELLRQVTSRAG